MTEVVSKLRGARTMAAAGELSIDTAKAREKMRLFRLPDPHMYVLQLVRAASVLGASTVTFHIRTTETICVFDAVFDPELLADVWSNAFAERVTPDRQAIHHLALGIGSAQALNPSAIDVRSGAMLISFRDDGEHIETLTATTETVIRVHEKFRFGHLVEYFESIVDEPMEAVVLRLRCSAALMRIVVNTVQISPPSGWEDAYGQDFDDARCEAVIVRNASDIKLTLTRDDLLLKDRVRTLSGLGGRVIVRSRSAETDLTGLELQGHLGPFPHRATDTFYRALHRHVQQDPRTADELRRMLGTIARSAEHSVGTTIEGQTQLLQWLLGQPIFELATGPSLASAFSAVRDGCIEYSTRSVPAAGAFEHVLLAEAQGALFLCLARLGFAVRDRTLALANAERRARGLARWSAVPRRDPWTVGPDKVYVSAHGYEGTVQPTAVGLGRGRIYVKGKLLRQVGGAMPFAIDIDGPFEPDEYFDNVLHDEEFEDFALALLDGARGSFANVPDRDAVRRILKWIATGEFEIELLGLVAYGRDEARDMLQRRRGDWERSTGASFLEAAGPLADLVLFKEDGPIQTVRQLITTEPLPLLADMREATLPEVNSLHPLMWGSESDLKFIRLLRPDAQLARDVLARRAAYTRFMTRPPFDGGPPDDHALFHRVAERDNVRFDLSLMPGRDPKATVNLVWNGRLLIRHRWTAPIGVWRATISCSEFTPNDAYTNVEHDDALIRVQRLFVRELAATLESWRLSVIEHRELRVRDMALFIELNLSIQADRAMHLAMQWDGGEWTNIIVSRAEILAAHEPGEGIAFAPFPTGLDGAVKPGGMVLRWPAGLDTAALQQMLGAVELVDLSDFRDATTRFLKDAARPASMDDAIGRYSLRREELRIEVGVFDADEPCHIVEILWRNRVLERVELPERLGAFRTKVWGHPIAPNMACDRVETGRDEALRAAEIAVGLALKRACADPVAADLRSVLIAMTQRLTALDVPPLHAAPLLNARLFFGPFGGFESAAERATRVGRQEQGDLIGAVAERLWLARGDRRDLLDDFLLSSISWGEHAELCHVTSAGITIARGHALVERTTPADPLAVAFLASCVYTEVNAYYMQISDNDELAFQHRLLRGARDR